MKKPKEGEYFFQTKKEIFKMNQEAIKKSMVRNTTREIVEEDFEKLEENQRTLNKVMNMYLDGMAKHIRPNPLMLIDLAKKGLEETVSYKMWIDKKGYINTKIINRTK